MKFRYFFDNLFKEDGNLKERAKRGSLWVVFTNVFTRVMMFLSTVLLARYFLTPKDFGLVGIIMIVTEIVNMFSFKGLSDTIIYTKELDKRALNSMFSVSAILGVLFFGTVWFGASAISNFFNNSQLVNLLKVTAFIFLLHAVSIIPLALLRKELAFRKESYALLFSQLISIVVTIVLAFLDFKVYSVIYGMLAKGVFLILFSIYYSGYLPWFNFDLPSLRSQFNYVKYVTGETLVMYIFNRVDQVIIGKFLGVTTLGYYSTAYNMVMYPLFISRASFHKILFSTYTKMQDDIVLLKDSFIKVSKKISIIFIPMFVGLSVLADIFIRAVFGPKWLPSIPIIEILSLNVMIKFIGNTLPQVMKSVGKPEYLFWYNVIRTVLIIPVLYFASQYSIITVVWTLFIFSLVFKPIELYMLNKEIGVTTNEYFKTFVFPVSASFIMASVLILLKHALHLPATIFTLVFYIVLGAAVYFLSFKMLHNDDIVELKIFAKSYLG